MIRTALALFLLAAPVSAQVQGVESGQGDELELVSERT